MPEQSWFAIEEIDAKRRALESVVQQALCRTTPVGTLQLGRDVQVVAVAELPAKPGVASLEGRARLLHDLASIELQAMELAVRGLCEYPEAPAEFREQLSEIALDEGRHLGLCLDQLRRMGFEWGDWNVHLALWNAVETGEPLLDRILIVHRYLEGSGLDAGDSISRRLSGVPDKSVRDLMQLITREEVGHVMFGSVWYRRLAAEQGLDSEVDFRERINEISRKVPRRERLAYELRRAAGFTEGELKSLEQARLQT